MAGRLASCLLLLCASAGAALADKPLGLEEVMRAPFASDLVAARSGRRAAWVTYREGRRNIWVAEGPSFSARQLTAYAEDDGQELSGLVFSDDGDLIVYVRGGDRNERGEVPNPALAPAGAEQAVWVVAWSGGAPRRIDAGSAPAISARGTIAYVNEGKLWLAPARGEGKPEQVKLRGKVSDPCWSPDGTKLAFTSDRDDHAFIGLLDADSRALRYLAPSVDRDASARWSRGGQWLAFVREPARPQDAVVGYFTAPDQPAPWAIWVASSTTAEAREVWSAPIQGTADQAPLSWAAGDRIVFPAEGDGWQRLHSVSAAGGAAIPLTPAGCEAESWALSSDGKELFYTSNCGDPERRHLARVPVAGGKVAPVTSGQGIEWSATPLGDGRTLAFLGSDARRSARPHVVALGSSDRPQELGGAPDAVPGAALVVPQPVAFKAPDGLELHGQIFPPRGPAGRHPAVIFLHGGPIRQMLPGWHYMRYYSNTYAFNQYLANRGYLVLSLNYRSGIGYGRDFRKAPGRAGRGTSEYQDVVAAGLYLRGRADVDSRRIALWGGSYGGYLTALGLGRNSDLFAAGVDLHGVHDWSVGEWAGAQMTPELTRLARDSSPVSAVATWRSPVLMISGDDDRNVSFAQTVDLVARLRERGVTVEQLVFPDEIHDFLLHRTWLEAFRAASDFLDRRLQMNAPAGR